MNVFIPVWGFGNAGGYRVLSKLADELIRRGANVTFICSCKSELPHYPTRAKVVWINQHGLITQRLDGVKGSFFTHMRSLTNGLKKVCSLSSCDIILANHNLTVYPAILAGLKAKIVYYIQAYEPEFYSVNNGLKNSLLAFLARGSYKFKLFSIVNAPVYRNYKEVRTQKVLYPGIDFEIFQPSSHKKSPNEKTIIGTIGRAEVFKGSSFVYEAFEMILRKYPDVELRIAFDTEGRFANNPKVERVFPKNDDELASFYQGLDFYFSGGYLQPGAFHYPVAEAMCCKVSVITTFYFPANYENAYIVPAKSADDFVEAFSYAIRNTVEKDVKVEMAFNQSRMLSWEKSGSLFYTYLQEKMASLNK